MYTKQETLAKICNYTGLNLQPEMFRQIHVTSTSNNVCLQGSRTETVGRNFRRKAVGRNWRAAKWQIVSRSVTQWGGEIIPLVYSFYFYFSFRKPTLNVLFSFSVHPVNNPLWFLLVCYEDFHNENFYGISGNQP